MPQHRPTLVPAIFTAFSFAAFGAGSAHTENAVKCITKPSASVPKGEHWYYRTDRAAKRQCWYLGPAGAHIQKRATQTSEQPALGAVAQPAAPQGAEATALERAAGSEAVSTEANTSASVAMPPWPQQATPQSTQQLTASAPKAASAETNAPAPLENETNVPAPVAPLPGPEASKLSDAPTPPLAERPASAVASDPAIPASSAFEETQSPANVRSVPARAADEADHTLTLAMIAFLTFVISGSLSLATRWLGRREATKRRVEWPDPSTLNTPYPRIRTSLDLGSRAASLHTLPQPPTPLEETEKLAQELQKILNELKTKHSESPEGAEQAEGHKQAVM
jgi:hypothetical protein